MNYFAFTYKYKDVTYKEKKETEIDILLLSQLAYLPMDNINFKNNKKYSLKEIADNIDRQVFLKSLIAQRNALKLLDTIKDLPRFKDIKVTCYEYEADINSQFGAVTCFLIKKLLLLFREQMILFLAGKKMLAFLICIQPLLKKWQEIMLKKLLVNLSTLLLFVDIRRVVIWL